MKLTEKITSIIKPENIIIGMVVICVLAIVFMVVLLALNSSDSIREREICNQIKKEQEKFLMKDNLLHILVDEKTGIKYSVRYYNDFCSISGNVGSVYSLIPIIELGKNELEKKP